MRGWKSHFASLEQEEYDRDSSYDFYQNVSVKKLPNTRLSKTRESLLKTKENMRLAMKRHRSQQKKIEKRARRIRKIAVELDPKSTESIVLNILLEANKPLHITEIIEKLEAAGKISPSKYHKYSSIYSFMLKNNILFQRVKKATFQPRLAVIEKTRKELSVKRSTNTHLRKVVKRNIPTISNIVLSIARKCAKEYIYPGMILNIMRQAGYNCAYSSVYRVMQGKSFKKKGLLYEIKHGLYNGKNSS